MTPERHRQIGELYHRARMLAPSERSALLEAASAGDSELRAEVESLLQADESAAGFLDLPAIDVAARLLRVDSPRARTRIGRFELLSLIGRGGMGDVYLAQDPVLSRQVAIKLLAPPLTADARALGRFEQEARAASSLNHPNIVTIHEIGVEDDDPYIAMELVEGRSLSALLGQPMQSSTVMSIARQLTQALAVAHAAGIVHRDVKPENIMVRPDGYVKLLDFGIARLLAPPSQTDSPTPTRATHAGVLIGTPGYMSPEQIRGEPATPASDVFALGAVLHELATGKHRSEHDLTVGHRATPGALAPAQTPLQMPHGLAELVRRMLDPDPVARPSAAEVASRLDALGEDPRHWGLRHVRRRRVTAVTILLVAFGGVGSLPLLLKRWPPSVQPSATSRIQFQVVPAPNTSFSTSAASLAISPDGRWLAYTASERQQGMQLWIKAWDSLEPKRVPNAEAAGQIFWSPDSRFVAFADTASGFKLKTVDVARGELHSMSDVGLANAGVGTWSLRHGILVRTAEPGLQQVPRDGGPPRPATTLDPARRETAHSFPVFLPDGEHFLYLASSTDPAHDSVAYVKAVGSKPPKRLLKSDSQVVYAAPGYLLYMLGFTLVAQPFDAATLEVRGEPRPIAERVERNVGSRRGAFTVSQTGVLAYRQHSETQLVWYQRDGRRLQPLGPPGHYRNPALSPDGRTIAVAKLDLRAGGWDIWTLDVERNLAAPLIVQPPPHDMPVWSPDGGLAFASQRREATPGTRTSFYAQAAGTGTARPLMEGLPQAALYAWSAEGFVYSRVAGGRNFDCLRLPSSGDPDRRGVAVLDTRFAETFCQPSADGRWMAYVSDESGRPEVYVARYPSAEDRTSISVAGGTEPAWRRDGRELFYLSPDRRLMSVPITTGSTVQAGTPLPLFETAMSSLIEPSYTRNQYVVTADGQRFLINEPVGKTTLSVITVVFNWATTFNSGS